MKKENLKSFEERVLERVVKTEEKDGCIYEYDDNGNEIHFKDSAIFEFWREFDEG